MGFNKWFDNLGVDSKMNWAMVIFVGAILAAVVLILFGIKYIISLFNVDINFWEILGGAIIIYIIAYIIETIRWKRYCDKL